MAMGSSGKKMGWIRFWKGFAFAFSGLKYAVRNERNLQVHFSAAIVVLILAIIIHIHFTEILILLIVIGIVISLELVNTAIEHVVDLVTEEQKPLAKLAKDVAAAAVLFFSIMAAIIGIMIFWHHLI